MAIHIADAAAQERAKYAEIWAIEEYRKADSPGLLNVERFCSVVEPKSGSSIIDIGCGVGFAGLDFQRRGLNTWWLDITDVALNDQIDRMRFIENPLWSNWRKPFNDRGDQSPQWNYGFCCDVLEHIPPEYTMLCIDRILWACKIAWLSIALRPDQFGKLIGEPLHLTVKPYSWWLLRLATLGTVLDARDLCGDGLFVVTRS